MGIAVFDSLLSGGERIYRNLAVSQRFDIRTIVQITKVVVYLVGGVAVLATLLGKSPLVFFSGLGAFTAVLLLIFKDTIPGLVAGIQLTVDNMVRTGDWIEVPSHNAGGTVLEVSLTIVGAELGQDHHCDPDLRAGRRAIQELARYGGAGGTPDQ